ncbi:MAG: ABC transporter permease [Alphaproteobacteria bacterium]|nr:MAG: ABC transporter permease [Alphaproteobacteria bacterium]
MTTTTETGNTLAAEAGKLRRQRRSILIGRIHGYLQVLGLGWITPILRLGNGEDPVAQGKALWKGLGIPLLSIAIFLLLWAQLAPKVNTSLGTIPGPAEVSDAFSSLVADHDAERAKAAAFYERQETRNAKRLEANPDAEIKWHAYTGKPTYFDQIWTSLQTVFMGFLLATLVAVPLGIVCGLSSSMNAAINPLVQIFKPVSPLAWLPIVTMVVSATYVSDNPLFEKSFLNSAITVTLCSLWPTLINTSMGVASIDKDLINVGRVLRLSTGVQVQKLIVPSAMPFIFTGMRLSLGVGWMVLIAAEMLAQNPGLGKFVWDEFQNGSSSSLAKIMVAVLTIGIIGFLLDRLMLALETLVTSQTQR